MKERIKTRIVREFWNNAADTFKGYLSVIIDNQTIWSVSTNISRANKADAEKDLADLRQQIKETNLI